MDQMKLQALALQAEGCLDAAKRRALSSLKYSVGILHADYQRAAKRAA